MNEQVKSYSCRVGQKKFYHSSNKARHQSACGKDKAFHCLHCKRAFARKDARDRHLTLHTKQEDIHHSREQEDEHLSEVGIEDKFSKKVILSPYKKKKKLQTRAEDVRQSREQESDHLSEVGIEEKFSEKVIHSPYKKKKFSKKKSARDHHEKQLQMRAEDVPPDTASAEFGQEEDSWISGDENGFEQKMDQIADHQVERTSADEGVILRSMNEYPTPLHLKTSTSRHRPPPPRQRNMSSNTSSISKQGYKSVRTPSTTGRRRRAGPYNTRANDLVNELRRRREEAELSGSLMSDQYNDETECIFQELEELDVIEYIPAPPLSENHFNLGPMYRIL